MTMADLNQLLHLLKQLEDQLVVCMRCGMCQAVCPLYAETGREADVARGKLSLLDGLLKRMFDDPAGTCDRLNKCLLCGSCQANCPSGVRVLEIFLKARAILTGYMGLPPAKQAIVRGLLGRPERFDRLTRWAAKFQKVFTRPANEIIGTSCARFMTPLIGDRHFVPLAPQPFHRQPAVADPIITNAGVRIAFFVGCLIDKIFPQVAQAALKALHHNGVAALIPDQQACCGIPALSAGDLTTFEKLVAHNVARFAAQRYDYLVTACATCTATIKELWPMMLPQESPVRKAAEAMAARTMDISQFLVAKTGAGVPSAPNDGQGVRVSYHDPCHLKKSLGVWKEPRKLLEASRKYALSEMAEADRCCGMGGSFNLQYYGLSSNIGQLKVDRIRGAQCATVATSCPACMLQLSDSLSKARESIQVRHVIELYAESLG